MCLFSLDRGSNVSTSRNLTDYLCVHTVPQCEILKRNSSMAQVGSKGYGAEGSSAQPHLQLQFTFYFLQQQQQQSKQQNGCSGSHNYKNQVYKSGKESRLKQGLQYICVGFLLHPILSLAQSKKPGRAHTECLWALHLGDPWHLIRIYWKRI